MCTWSNLRPFLLPTEWERWDLRKTFCFICGVAISFGCGHTLCSIEGHVFWTVSLILEVAGLVLFVAVSSIFWLILQSFVGGGVRCVQSILNTLYLHRRPKEILQTFFLSCMGTGAVASLESRAFMEDFGDSDAVQFGQACAQVVAVVISGVVGLFMTRNLIFLYTYKLALAIRHSYSNAYVKPMQITVPDLSKEAPGECSVCLRSLADDDGKGVLRLFCAHTFHTSCINHWLRVREACPVCRARVRTFRSCVHIRQEKRTSNSPEEQCVSQVAITRRAESLEPVDIEVDPVDVFTITRRDESLERVDIEADPVDVEADAAVVEAVPATSGVATSGVEFASPRRCTLQVDSQQAATPNAMADTPESFVSAVMTSTPSAITDTPGSLVTASPTSAVIGLPVSDTSAPKEARRKRRSDKPKRKPPKPARARSDSDEIGEMQGRVRSRSSSGSAMSDWSLGSAVTGPSLSRSTICSIDSMDSIDSEARPVAPHAPPPANVELHLGREVDLDMDPDVLLQSISRHLPNVGTNIDVDDNLLLRAVSEAQRGQTRREQS